MIWSHPPAAPLKITNLKHAPTRDIPHFRHLSYFSHPGFWCEMLGVGDFYYELGVQIVELCVATSHRNGGVISLEEILGKLNHRRKPDNQISVLVSSFFISLISEGRAFNVFICETKKCQQCSYMVMHHSLQWWLSASSKETARAGFWHGDRRHRRLPVHVLNPRGTLYGPHHTPSACMRPMLYL